MGWQPGPGGGTGTGPDHGPGLPGGAPPAHDPRLGLFAVDGSQAGPVPCGRLALLADELSGAGRRSPGATANELIGLLRAWAALESWAAGAKLGVIRELMRRDGTVSPGCGHGDLPETWSPSLRYELAAALACSTQSAETSAWLAWELQARLPGIGALLDDGILTFAKARAVIETFRYLSATDAATAEALILGRLTGKTYTQVLRLAEQASLTVDPELAARRREQAQKKDARVTLLREPAGTAALSGRDLPPDEALAAMASVNARAGQYRESGAFGDTPMDVLRAQGYLDLLNGVPAEARIACAQAQDEAAEAAEDLAWAEARAARTAAQARAAHQPGTEPGAQDEAETPPGPEAGTPDKPDSRHCDGGVRSGPRDCPCGECDGGSLPDDGCGDPDNGSHGRGGETDDHGDHIRNRAQHCRGDDDDDDEPGDSSDPDDGGDNGGPGPGGPDPRPGVPPTDPVHRRPADLIVPLTTLLGLADRPGEIQGFGLLDPALARELAAAAVVSPRTEVCVTVTSPGGYAIGHGCCACPDRTSRSSEAATSSGQSPAGLPARLNLTIPATALRSLTGRASDADPWAFTPRESQGPPDGYGAWTLTLPGGRRFTVRLDLVPTFSCDHRYESHGYQPSDKLRHLVQVRDGTCTFPSCNRHAHESDFEHAMPYDKGGRTCTCNAGARSRACHRVKQSPGWNVTQPKPGWHRWETPAGRVYVQEPKRYPA